MKYYVFVVLLGINSCDNSPHRTVFTYEVTSKEECLEEAEDLAKYPFVEVAECKVVHLGQ